jgi:YHS domain-containing protein
VIRLVLLGLLLFVVAWAFWRMIDGIIAGLGGLPQRRGGDAPSVKLVRDPVCGTWVAPKPSLSVTARGTTHYFCSEECRGQFRKRA